MDGKVNQKITIDTRVAQNSFEATHTADCAIFGYSDKGLQILLVKRGIAPFKDYWMLPGGIVQEGQTLESAASMILDTLLGVQNVYVQQIKTYSDVERHPVKRVITTGFYALVKPENHTITPKKYLTEAVWHPVDQNIKLGFDHNIILPDALTKLRHEALYNHIGLQLLPEKFTLRELQQLYETILGQKLDRRNFRRKINALNLIVDSKEIKNGVQGGPSLFKINPELLNENEI